jgi:hypothetical protein
MKDSFLSPKAFLPVFSLAASGSKAKNENTGRKAFEERKESFMEKNWEPDAALIDQANEYGISKSFVLSQLDDFVHLHREKSDTSHSWGVKFLRFVIKQWRSQEISDFKKLKRKAIDQSWLPDEEAIEILAWFPAWRNRFWKFRIIN